MVLRQAKNMMISVLSAVDGGLRRDVPISIRPLIDLILNCFADNIIRNALHRSLVCPGFHENSIFFPKFGRNKLQHAAGKSHRQARCDIAP